MIRRAAAVLTLALAAGAAVPRVPRAALQALERGFDQRVQRHNIDDPFDLLGSTRAVYLERYGVVFSAELNLVTGPSITPFHPKLTPQELARLRQKKLARVGELRQIMREMMVHAAATLKNVPPDEQVVVAVTLLYLAAEDTTGLPAQIVLQAPRKVLVDYESGRLTPAALQTAIQEQVF